MRLVGASFHCLFLYEYYLLKSVVMVNSKTKTNKTSA